MPMHRLIGLLVPVIVLAIWGGNPPPAAAASCESLTSLSLPDTTITSAQPIAAGAFTPPNLPGFCRVQAAVKRSGETDVKIEVWLPAQGWNGDFQPAASGFGGGTIRYGGLSRTHPSGAATGATTR